jgi:hypothetical protein
VLPNGYQDVADLWGLVPLRLPEFKYVQVVQINMLDPLHKLTAIGISPELLSICYSHYDARQLLTIGSALCNNYGNG